tara:strand:- start:21949 stop:22089 length:141 start_codon:yes stop_codon:yes gene_type:complete
MEATNTMAHAIPKSQSIIFSVDFNEKRREFIIAFSFSQQVSTIPCE